MKRHTFYPKTMPTVTRPYIKVLRALRWLLLSIALVCMAALASLVILKLATIDAQLDGAFMQGMSAAAQLCRGGT
jgi:hypothetical protein